MTFIDSNILVYSIDDNSPEKQRKARAIVARAIGGYGFMVSAQVLNEFTNVALAKMRLTLPEVGKFVAVFKRIKSVSVDCGWTERALAIKAQYGTQFYDSFTGCGCRGQRLRRILVRGPERRPALLRCQGGQSVQVKFSSPRPQPHKTHGKPPRVYHSPLDPSSVAEIPVFTSRCV